MALVDYASSDEEQDDAQAPPSPPTLKRKRPECDDKASDLPPLPSRFHDLYASTARVSTTDDPSLHGGRKRVTPHVEGNWPTHLYIEWYPSTPEHTSLTALISTLKGGVPPGSPRLHSLLTSDLDAPLPLHISLSRSIGFSTERKNDFVAALQRTIRSSGIRPFEVAFSSLDWVPNFEKSRWFLVLRINAPGTNGLNKLLHVSNKVVQEHGQPPLYTRAADEKISSRESELVRSSSTPVRGEPRVEWHGMQDASDAFHISIAWALEPPSNQMLDATRSLAMDQFEEVKKALLKVEDIKAKVGNVVTSIRLHRTVVEGESMFGL